MKRGMPGNSLVPCGLALDCSFKAMVIRTSIY